MSGELQAGNANGWLGAGGVNALAALAGGTGVVEVTAGVPSVFAVPANQIPFGNSGGSGLLAASANLTWDGATFKAIGATQGGGGGVNDKAAAELVKGHNNGAGAVDIYAEATTTSGEFLTRWYNQGDVPSAASVPATYINGSGAIYSRSFVVISGTFTGVGINSRFTHPTADPFMVGIWADVADALVLRAAASGNRLLRGIVAGGGTDTMYLTDTGVFSLGTNLGGAGKTIVATPGTPNLVLTSTAATDFPRFRAQTHDPYIHEMGVGSSSAGTPYAGLSVTNDSYVYSTALKHKIFLATAGEIEFYQDSTLRFTMKKTFTVHAADGYIDVSAITGRVFFLPTDATGNATAATGRVPVDVGGGLKYFRYYDD